MYICCLLAITVNFSQPSYSVQEDAGSAQIGLVLSKSLASDVVVFIELDSESGPSSVNGNHFS